jgi:peptide/nickel transport system substrate-binding protein
MKRLTLVISMLFVMGLWLSACVAAAPEMAAETEAEEVVAESPEPEEGLWYNPDHVGETWINICTDAPPTYGGVATDIFFGWGESNPTWWGTGYPMFYSFSQLYDVLGDGVTLEPDAAESWEVSADGLTYTFNLRNDVKFHDGEQLTADDVKYSFEVHAHPEVGAWNAGWMPYRAFSGGPEFLEGSADEISGIVALDDFTLQINVLEPQMHLEYLIATINLLPAHLMQEIPFGELMDSDLVGHPVGTGPFKFVEHVPSEYTSFEAFEDYYGGRPYLDRAIYRIGVTGSTATWIAALEKGEIQTGYLASGLDRVRLAEDPNVVLIAGPTAGGMYLNMNTERVEHKVRQALMFAIDKEAIAEGIWLGHAEAFDLRDNDPAGEWVSPDITIYDYDPEKAKTLLEEAGWDPDRELSIITYYQGDLDRRVLAALQDQWGQVGIKVEVNVLDTPAFIERSREAGDYDIGYACCGGPAAPYEYTRDSCEKSPYPNWSRNCNEEMDTLVLSGIAEPDPEKRRDLFYQATEIATESAYQVAIFRPDRRYAISKDLCNYTYREYLLVFSDQHPDRWYLRNQ